jgi:glycolate oxidase FAD binding subunit
VAWAASEEAPLEVLGQGSKRAMGRPLQTAYSLDLSGLSGISLYEPEELVLTAKAGTPMAEIEAAIAERKQCLAFEPPDLGPLFGAEAGRGTLGGTLSCNLAGPRRPKAGAARDHFLGLQCVSGRGEAFKGGGRVVKNVTGYDLMKLLAGAYGTLAVMTEVTVKVLPAPAKTYSVLLYGLDDKTAQVAMTRALNSSHEVSGAAHLPTARAAGSEVSYVAGAGGAVTAIRVEGPGPSVEYRTAALRRELADLGPSEELHSRNSTILWREIRDVRPFQADAGAPLWKVSVPPSQGPRLTAALPGASYFFDWGGGLVWLTMPPGEDGGAAAVRRAVDETGGHATLLRAEAGLRARVPVFQPLEPGLQALSQRVKQSFDPRGVLNPGRMHPGM